MKKIRGFLCLSVIAALFVLIGACAAIPRLNIAYVMIPGGIVSEERNPIGLRVADERDTKNILGPRAESEFRGRLETASLRIGRPFGEMSPAGVFDVPGLWREAFRRKLSAAGLEPEMGTPSDIPGLLIAVREFVLDVEGRDWVGRISYDARLLVDGEIKFSRTVEGSARRMKFVGRSEAETLMGELFTDSVNRLDLPRFFDLAGIEWQ